MAKKMRTRATCRVELALKAGAIELGTNRMPAPGSGVHCYDQPAELGMGDLAKVASVWACCCLVCGRTALAPGDGGDDAAGKDRATARLYGLGFRPVVRRRRTAQDVRRTVADRAWVCSPECEERFA